MEEAEGEVRELVRARKWDEALQRARRMMDELHSKSLQLRDILRRVKLDVRALRDEDSGGAWCLLGIAYLWGEGGVPKSGARAEQCFQRGALKEHALACYYKAWRLAAQSRPECHALYVQAARLGCPASLRLAGRACQDGKGTVPQSYAQAAMWYQRASDARLHLLLRKYPVECTPFGAWRADASLQLRVMPEVAAAQACWMKCSKRLGVVRGVALMVVAYVCTRSGWQRAPAVEQ